MPDTESTSSSKPEDVHLSPALKDLIANSRYAETPIDEERLDTLFSSIHRNKLSSSGSIALRDTTDGESVQGLWLVILMGALFALNAVDAIPHLYRYAVTQTNGDEEKLVFVAERMREVGLKTVSFMGVPRVSLSSTFPPFRTSS